ncbi:MAG: tRNA pseudouridine(55) synthase TruB [Microbacterium sp.]
MSSGVLLVDKPQGVTSHDVVARTRRAFGTRKVGHAGTLDPMATGLLLIGINGATRLLTYLVGLGKTYEATIRLGEATTTDDAEGEVTERAEAALVSAVSDERIDAGIAALTGQIEQVPSAVSAIKVDGRRAYERVRAGESVELKARAVTVSRFQRTATRRLDGAIELDVSVDCSSGTYIRALARDLGADLGVGGHLTFLRRTRVGGFDVADAVDGDHLDGAVPMDPVDVAAMAVGRIDVTADQAQDLRHGKRLDGLAERVSGAHAAAVDPSGVLVGIVEKRGTALKSAMNMPEKA